MTNSRILLRKTALVLLAVTSILPAVLRAQNLRPAAPREEKLLNGLKVLMWNDAKADKVSVSIRIHSGTAFDPQGKEGVMKLLAAHLFPNAESREFFAEELGGTLDVISNYDFIQVNATSTPDKFVDLLDTLANAINNINIDKDSTPKLKAQLAEQIKHLSTEPAYIADQTARSRLLGAFPYGRPESGTTESLARIDFADVIFAKQRFLTADNATVTVAGNFDPILGFRALRRYFGNWLKSDKKIPTAFKQPDVPDTSFQTIKVDSPGKNQVRYAVRGVARNDKDYPAADVFYQILERRLRSGLVKDAGNGFVRNEARVLPGLLMIGFESSTAADLAAIPSLLRSAISAEEFNSAKVQTIAAVRSRTPAEWWLDVDTYKISVSDEASRYENLTLSDVQRVSERLLKNPMVSVSVTSSSPAAVLPK